MKHQLVKGLENLFQIYVIDSADRKRFEETGQVVLCAWIQPLTIIEKCENIYHAIYTVYYLHRSWLSY